ncbi:MAG: sulfur carrier protein ThiS [Gammaproteobacteria bacterium]|nr:sulfur carrier protein ThiS [Gammaproteobacteria bacterium]
MNIIVNGENREIPDNSTAADLIATLDMTNARIAMEVNMEIIPRSQHADFRLHEGDKIEIVRAIGGG